MNKFVNRIRKIGLETFCAIAFILPSVAVKPLALAMGI